MSVCSNCGEENPDRARFCLSCGTGLAETRQAERRERRVVSVLFADLAGFTSRSESLDVEDVEGFLAPYLAVLRSEVERTGGQVVKFTGDGVMAIFGAATAHEDDPERAVRAGLGICERVSEARDAELQVRVGVTSGEALVSHDPAGGVDAVGDVVNTAARLESAAPLGGVLVDGWTYRATERAIRYQAAEPVEAKGKSEPVLVWRAVETRSKLGVDVAHESRTALVGRDRELAELTAALKQAMAAREPRMVTVVGAPGIGKSRLVWELRAWVDRLPELVQWRQGRCLPYGEGVSFWALAEIVKAEAGIRESDTADAATDALAEMVRNAMPEARDAAWVETHLRRLVGLEGRDLSGDHRLEAFAAWRTIIEALARQRPLVLVIEDLHWADDGLLEFLGYLMEWAAGVPLLVICTARPELLDRPAAEPVRQSAAEVMELASLSGADTARLIAGLLEQAVLPAEAQDALLARAEGNPLFAHEYVRMLIDRGYLARRDRRWVLIATEELPLPESVQGVIAARLDALSAHEKQVLRDAAVVGKVVWVGAVAYLGDRGKWAVEAELQTLVRKQFLWRQRDSSLEGEGEYVFQHALTRDVAYSQIMRSERADKHERAAHWISEGSTRDDRLELIAHHWLAVLELRHLAGADIDDIRGPALQAVCAAGERALRLNSYAAARSLFERGLQVGTPVDAVCARLQFGVARARYFAEDVLDPKLPEIAKALAADGAILDAAEAETIFGLHTANHGNTKEGFEHLVTAVELLEHSPPTRQKAWAMTSLGSGEILAGFDVTSGIARERAAMTIAHDVGSLDLEAEGACFLAYGQAFQDDPAAVDGFSRGVELALEATAPAAVLCLQNAAGAYFNLGFVARSEEVLAQSRKKAKQLGCVLFEQIAVAAEARLAFHRGDWMLALELADLLETDINWFLLFQLDLRATTQLSRGQFDRAAADAARALEVAREIAIPEDFLKALGLSCRVYLETSGVAPPDLLEELFSVWTQVPFALAEHSDTLAWTARAAGEEGQLLDTACQIRLRTDWLEAAVAIANGAFLEAADRYAEIGSRPLEARARLEAAQQLRTEGRLKDATAELDQCAAFWTSVRATAYLQQVELLAGDLMSA